MFKMVFWLGLIGGGVLVAAQVLPVYNNEMKINNAFEGIAKNLSSQSPEHIRKRLQQLLKIQSVDMALLPDTFFENLSITKDDNKLQISSEYHVDVWLLGKPVSVDPEKEYSESDVEPMDKLRLRAKLDFDFAPYQETK